VTSAILDETSFVIRNVLWCWQDAFGVPSWSVRGSVCVTLPVACRLCV